MKEPRGNLDIIWLHNMFTYKCINNQALPESYKERSKNLALSSTPSGLPCCNVVLFCFSVASKVLFHLLFSHRNSLFVLRFYGPVNPMGLFRAWSVYLTTRLLGRPVLTSILHILSPETDNCRSWISGRERMTVENISWSISMKECCRPRRGLNPRPPGLQSDSASNWATEAGITQKQRKNIHQLASKD